MEKQQELLEWKEHLKELTPIIMEQIDWLEQGDVVASVNPNCPEKLKPVAERLVAIQNSVGEYQRNQISKEDIERIKYYSKNLKIGFYDVVKLAVNNSRYVSKDALEAKGVVGFILEIQSVYNKIYKQNGVFPINAMSAESKRACRSFETDVSLKEKIEAIIEVFLPELKGINIVDRDYSIVPQSKYELSKKEIAALVSYFESKAIAGKINSCFDAENQNEFLEVCKLLAKANMTVDEFLKKHTKLTYSKCYSAEIVPAVKQMVLAYQERFDTTTKIREFDPYLRSKIDAAERAVGRYTVRDLLNYWQIPNDNSWEGRNCLSREVLEAREEYIVERLNEFYPNGVIDKNFISEHLDMYEELKLLSNRRFQCGVDEYLRKFGFVRQSSHSPASESVIFLSEADLKHYKFDKMSPLDFDECQIAELNPRDYFGVYNKLVWQGLDSLGLAAKHAAEKGE